MNQSTRKPLSLLLAATMAGLLFITPAAKAMNRCEHWLSVDRAVEIADQLTLTGYRRLIENHLLLAFAHRLLSSLDTREMAPKAIEILTSQRLARATAAEKAEVWISFMSAIQHISQGEWRFTAVRGVDGSFISWGPQGHALVIAPNGVIYRGHRRDVLGGLPLYEFMTAVTPVP